MSLLLILIASIYLAIEFRQPLRTPLPPNLGVNYAGLSSCFALPISLLSSAIYSEAFWQRCWVSTYLPTYLPMVMQGLPAITHLTILSHCIHANKLQAAEDPYSLRWGAIVGFFLTTVVIAFFGFVGFLGLWAGLPRLDDNNNLAFFVPFSDYASKGKQRESSLDLDRCPHYIRYSKVLTLSCCITGGEEGSNTGAVIVRVLLVVLATTMNESAVDSLQNAIVATLSSTFFIDK